MSGINIINLSMEDLRFSSSNNMYFYFSVYLNLVHLLIGSPFLLSSNAFFFSHNFKTIDVLSDSRLIITLHPSSTPDLVTLIKFVFPVFPDMDYCHHRCTFSNCMRTFPRATDLISSFLLGDHKPSSSPLSL